MVSLPAYNLYVQKIALLLALFISMALVGCENTPIKVEELKVKAPPELTLPIEAQVRIDTSERELAKSHTVYDPRMSWNPTLWQGGLMQSAATQTFKRVFSNVSIPDQKPHLVVRAKSQVKTSVSTGIHSAKVTALIEKYDGAVVGEFVGTGSEISKDIANSIALSNAFIEAFIEILSQLVADKKFLSLVEEGYFDAPP